MGMGIITYHYLSIINCFTLQSVQDKDYWIDRVPCFYGNVFGLIPFAPRAVIGPYVQQTRVLILFTCYFSVAFTFERIWLRNSKNWSEVSNVMFNFDSVTLNIISMFYILYY